MAQIRADEIARVLREEIENYDKAVSISETGSVISVGDGIARIHGLENVMAGEMIEFPHGVAGIAMNLEEDQVGAVLMGEYTDISEGDEVRRTGRIMSVPVGEALIGRVVNALGQPIDGALIGGVTARIGSTIYDGSVRGQLDALRRKMTAE